MTVHVMDRHKGIYSVVLKSVVNPGQPWRTMAYWAGDHWRHVAHTRGDNTPRIEESDILEVGDYLGSDKNNPR